MFQDQSLAEQLHHVTDSDPLTLANWAADAPVEAPKRKQPEKPGAPIHNRWSGLVAFYLPAGGELQRDGDKMRIEVRPCPGLQILVHGPHSLLESLDLSRQKRLKGRVRIMQRDLRKLEVVISFGIEPSSTSPFVLHYVPDAEKHRKNWVWSKKLAVGMLDIIRKG